jgi:hypothetical protein
VLDNGKGVQKHPKRSLDTKDPREANIRAKAVLAEFDRIIGKAKALIADATFRPSNARAWTPPKSPASPEHVYAEALAWDERVRFGGRDEMKWMEAEIIRLNGAVDPPLIPLEQWPQRGVPRKLFEENHAELLDSLPMIQQAAAMGDISVVEDHVKLALATFSIELDEHSPAYIKVSTACLHSYLRALGNREARRWHHGGDASSKLAGSRANIGGRHAARYAWRLEAAPDARQGKTRGD